MDGIVGRRAFVGSVASGLPLLAVGTVPVFAQGARSGGSALLRDGKPDAVFAQALRELGRVHARGRRHQRASGEDARAVAAQLRGMAVYMADLDMDGSSRRALRQLIAKHGREGLLTQSVDMEQDRKALRQYGLELDAPWRRVPEADYQMRSQALDALLKNGPIAEFHRAAEAFERIGAHLDTRSVSPAGIRRVGQTWEEGFCQQLAAELARLGVAAGFLAGISFFFRRAKAAELAVLAAMAIQNGFYWYYCGFD